MIEWFSKAVSWYPSSVLYFDVDLISQNLWIPTYNNYQHFLYKTITDLRNKVMNDVQITKWLNDNGHQKTKGHSFKNNQFHSI